MEQDNKTNLLPKDLYEQVMSLPDRKIRRGGEIIHGKIDPETGYFYPMDEDGHLTGTRQMTNFKKQTPPASEESNDSSQTIQKDYKPEEHGKKKAFAEKLRGLANRATEKKPSQDEEKEGFLSPSQRKLLIIIAIVVGFIVFVIAFDIFRSMLVEMGSGTQEENNPPIENTDSDLSQISVIQVTKDLIPGDQIKSSDLQEYKMSASDYNMFTLADVSVYKWDAYESLINKYVTEFIPSGRYLTYTNVNSAYVAPQNPWLPQDASYTTITVPVDPQGLLNYGSVTDVDIKISSLKETAKNPEVSSTAGELEHKTSIEQSYVVDSYKLNGVVVCDLLNRNKKSIYPTYASWIKIPTGEQLPYIQKVLQSNSKLFEELQPVYVSLVVTTETASTLGEFSEQNSEIKFSNYKTADTSTDYKKTFAAQSAALRNTIVEANSLKSAATDDE